MESRLADLEMKLGLNEHMLEELNHTVYRQQQEIERLQQDLRALRQQVQSSAPETPRSLFDELPPHY